MVAILVVLKTEIIFEQGTVYLFALGPENCAEIILLLGIDASTLEALGVNMDAQPCSGALTVWPAWG